MLLTRNALTWVVYRLPVPGKKGQEERATGVCRQSEWEQMEQERPGYLELVRAGIPSEGEAERLARGTAGDPPVRKGARL